MAPGQQVRAFAFVLVVRPVPGRALLLGGQLGFELLDPRLECGNHIGHRKAAWGPYGQRFVLQLVKINSDQGLTILVVRARQAVALDDGARALGRDVEAVANLSKVRPCRVWLKPPKPTKAKTRSVFTAHVMRTND